MRWDAPSNGLHSTDPIVVLPACRDPDPGRSRRLDSGSAHSLAPSSFFLTATGGAKRPSSVRERMFVDRLATGHHQRGGSTGLAVAANHLPTSPSPALGLKPPRASPPQSASPLHPHHPSFITRDYVGRNQRNEPPVGTSHPSHPIRGSSRAPCLRSSNHRRRKQQTRPRRTCAISDTVSSRSRMHPHAVTPEMLPAGRLKCGSDASAAASNQPRTAQIKTAKNKRALSPVLWRAGEFGSTTFIRLTTLAHHTPDRKRVWI
jgi:hypothetical protein